MSTALLFALWTSLEEGEGRSPDRDGEAPRLAVSGQPTWEEGRWSAAFGRVAPGGTPVAPAGTPVAPAGTPVAPAGTPPRSWPVIPEQRRPDRAGLPQTTAG